MSNCKPCKSTYNNRLNETKQSTKVQDPVKDSTTEVKFQEDKTLNTIKCGKEIISITQVGRRVVVLYDDCSYSVVSSDKVNIDIQVNECKKELPKVTNIAESNGKVIVTLDNGNFIEADKSVIDSSLTESLSQDQLNKIKELTEFKDNLEKNLVPVMNFNGDTTHYGINVDTFVNKPINR